MSTLSWNCRALENPDLVRHLPDLVSTKRPNFIFLMETKVRQERVLQVRCRLGYVGSFIVDPVGIVATNLSASP